MLLPQLREQVEQRMLANGFSDYEDLAKWVRGQGYDISDDSLRRYGKSLNQEFAATYIGTSAVHRGFPRIAALPSGFSDLRLGEATKICWREIAEPQRSAFKLIPIGLLIAFACACHRDKIIRCTTSGSQSHWAQSFCSSWQSTWDYISGKRPTIT